MTTTTTTTNETNQIELIQFDTDNTANIHKRWSRWAKRLDRMLDIKNIKEDSTKINYLFFYGGDNLEDVYSEIAEITDCYEDIVRKLCNLFSTYETTMTSESENNINNSNDNDQLDNDDGNNNKPANEEVTFELVLDEENEVVNDLIQRYNRHLSKMKELEKEKQELDELIKKTIGLKIRQVTSTSSSNTDNSSSNADNVPEDEKKKEQCIDLLCKSICLKKSLNQSPEKKYVSFDCDNSLDSSVYFNLPPPPLHLLNYKRPCMKILRPIKIGRGCNDIYRFKF